MAEARTSQTAIEVATVAIATTKLQLHQVAVEVAVVDLAYVPTTPKMLIGGIS